MAITSEFDKIFTHEHLKEIYHSDIRHKSSPGIDGINRRTFELKLDENIDIIHRKVHKMTYQFSQYREKLLVRGQNKYPRVLSIPTIRDKITLRALLEVLLSEYGLEMPFLHKIINEITQSIKKGIFDSVIRLDVADFYPSIKHEILFAENY